MGAYRWSPNAQMIAFTMFQYLGENILEDLWVMQADGTGKRHLAFNATSPTWAPSSLRLGYITHSDYGDLHLRTVNIDGSGDRRVTPPGLNVFQPAWSTMNPRIAFVTLGEKALHVIDPDGTDMVRLSPLGAEDDMVSWSPDGTKILFMTDPHESEQGSNIGVMDPNGSNRRIITDTPGFEIASGWSPDSRQIVFYADAGAYNDVFLMSADGSGARNLTNRPGTDESGPSWAGAAATAAVEPSTAALHARLRQALRRDRRP
jgi:TolB protein